jgi:Rod binding domain-containing protein
MDTLGVSQMSSASQASAPLAVPQPRLVKAAHEFEAQMMKEMMAPLTKSTSVPGVGGSGSDDDQDSGSGGALGEFAAEALGKALSAAGGFGIANRVIGEIGHTGGHTGTGTQGPAQPVTTKEPIRL